MSTKSRQTIYGGAIMGAKMRAQGDREDAIKAVREADCAEAEAWSIQMESYGGPGQPSPTVGQCLNGDLGWLEVECNVNRRDGMTPPRSMMSVVYRADRRRTPCRVTDDFRRRYLAL